MHSQSKIISIFAILALLLGNAAGWLHVHHHAGGHCDHVVVGELHSHTGDDCHSSPLATRGVMRSCETAGSGDGDWPRPHESDDCVICQHFMTCRDIAAAIINPVFCTGCQPTESALVLAQVWRDDFADSVRFLRGPPLV